MPLVKYPDEGPGPRVLMHQGVVNSEKFITYVNDFGKELNSISCHCRQAFWLVTLLHPWVDYTARAAITT
jgi:hypothetical protein